MRVNSSNYKEMFSKLGDKDYVSYKQISFNVIKDRHGFTFQLRGNIFCWIIAIISMMLINILIGLAFKDYSGFMYMAGGVIIVYFARKLSIFITEQIFRSQLVEFYTILSVWNKERMEINK
ncbi:TPA: hypothetical protein ACGQK4_002212 [Elizabethkingia anophelis]|nr:hypothetical protein [Elizabethkingia anophelis]